jgi:adenylate cyclase
MQNQSSQSERAEKVWRDLLTTGEVDHTRRIRRIFKLVPSDPRCGHCNRPFTGIGGVIVRLLWNIRPSKLNPRYCNDCENFSREYPGGAEVELAMLFVDVRGSTPLAERVGVADFTQLIDRFYRETSHVLIQSDALIEKLVGDEVAALYVPGYAGSEYTERAVQAAQDVLKITGHGDREGPWIPVGAGLHKGKAFVGTVGSKEGIIEITALGDAVNITARLAGEAKQGEILVSEEACTATKMDYEKLEQRQLSLKGRNEPVTVRVISVKPH